MARAVTADHIKFSECIDIFKSRENIIKKDNKRFYGYLFLDFKLPLSWQFLDFDIHETLGDWNNQILLVSPYSAFVAPVLMPQWVDRHNGHLFTIALSSVASFCTGRSIKSTRDDYCIDKKITNRPKELAIQHPVLTAGPGGYNTNLSSKSLLEFKKRIDETTSILDKLPDEKYTKIFQAIRLVHLALMNKREDYDLSFSLLVAAIESVAQETFGRTGEKLLSIQLDENEKEIERLCHGRGNLERWFKKKVLQEAKLKEKYVEFIFRYAPVKKWYELKHPLENLKEYISEVSNFDYQNEWITKKRWNEYYPSDIDSQGMRRIIENTYKYRSGFFHEGKPTPHRYPTESSRFFERQIVIDADNKKNPFREIILPKFELMFEISRIAITKYAGSVGLANIQNKEHHKF